MNDLDRLHDSSPNARTRALLLAGEAERPADDFTKRLLVGVAAASAATVTHAAAAAGGAKLGSVVQGVAASSGAPSLALVAAKWVAVGVLGGGILAAGAERVFSPTPAETIAPSHVETRAVPTTAVLMPPTAPDTAVLAPPTESAAPPIAGAAERRSEAVLPSSAAAPSGPLGREVQIIDDARRALAAGNTARALAELDGYDKIASTGALDREARVLRIQALRKAGDDAGARKLTEQYLNDFPNDAHTRQLRPSHSPSSP
jgi:hypothetical protein